MRILVLRHGKDDGLGRIVPALVARGMEAEVRSFVESPGASFDLGRYGGLIVLGGPMSAEIVMEERGEAADFQSK